MKKRKNWSPEEDAVLRERYADTDTRCLAEMLGRSLGSTYYRASLLGLGKSQEFLKNFGKRLSVFGEATRFKKGFTPFSKGKRIDEIMSPEGIRRSSVTRFKPGHRTANKQPVGYETVRGDGYVWIKVADGAPMVQKQRWVWEQHHGRIPEGCHVCFLDGDRTNCDISNLVLRSCKDVGSHIISSLSPEQKRKRIERSQATRNEAIRKDKMRIRWGLEPRTNLVKRWYPYESKSVRP